MADATSVVEAFLQAHDLAHHHPDDTTWVLEAEGDAGEWFMQITVVPEFGQVIVYADLDVDVPPPQRAALATWAARANRGLPVGSFEVDVDEGGVWCKTSIDVEGDSLSEALLGNLLGNNQALVERYLPGLRRWLAGDLDGPEEAVMVAEGFLD